MANNPTKHIDVNLFKRFLSYDESSGIFTWIFCRNRSDYIGKSAGTLNNHGYISICISQKLYQAHRIAWAFFHGSIDENLVIDHIDGNRSNNRIGNLRVGTQSQNVQNMRSSNYHSATGVLGVTMMNPKRNLSKPYLVQIKKGMWSYRKYFATLEEARDDYIRVKRERHEFNTL